MFRWLRTSLFGISPAEASFRQRGFLAVAAPTQQRLEQCGQSFIEGYNAALRFGNAHGVTRQLAAIGDEQSGFAFEGAAMGLALLDGLTIGPATRLRDFLRAEGQQHVYMVFVGVGWAAARLPWYRHRVTRYIDQFDPLLRWLVVDGFGFHHGYFNHHTAIGRQMLPNGVFGYARQAFDQGLGRSLWFVAGGDVGRIRDCIEAFDERRRPDLYGGIGLACAYAGGVDDCEIERLAASSVEYVPQLAQGAAFAAKARQRAENPAEHTDRACRVLCGTSAAEAARITDQCLAKLPDDAELPAYEIWRNRIQQHFLAEVPT